MYPRILPTQLRLFVKGWHRRTLVNGAYDAYSAMRMRLYVARNQASSGRILIHSIRKGLSDIY